ncbi:MAG: H-X9-DG-CTERM domain-containing protein, partial [Planctomycetota bacterium]
YTDANKGFYAPIHGNDYSSPQPPYAEWWELLLPYGMKREYMQCRSDPKSEDLSIQSYLVNGMVSFTKKQSQVSTPSQKIIVSERADEGSVLTHQGYPAWKELSVWNGHIKHDRHTNVSNYLFADAHVESLEFTSTVGEAGGNDHRNDTNKHYIKSFDPPAP